MIVAYEFRSLVSLRLTYFIHLFSYSIDIVFLNRLRTAAEELMKRNIVKEGNNCFEYKLTKKL